MKKLIVAMAALTLLMTTTVLTLTATAQTKNDLKAKAVSTVAADQPGAKAKKLTPEQKAAEQQRDAEEEKADAAAAKTAETTADAAMAGLDDDSVAAEALTAMPDSAALLVAPLENEGFHKSLKRKFIEGNAGFMALVALALILGLAFCIERIIFLTLSEVDARRLMDDVSGRIANGDLDGAKELCRTTRGPVAAICSQGLDRIDEPVDDIERAVAAYGAVQAANLEKGCSWITLFIAMAPSLGFLGTVIGMVMAFDQIQQAGDISPTIVAAGMKVALITTIFGIIVALILQLFYNYILSKIERLTAQMEESAITLMDAMTKYKQNR